MFGGGRFFLVQMLTEILLFGVFVGIAIARGTGLRFTDP